MNLQSAFLVYFACRCQKMTKLCISQAYLQIFLISLFLSFPHNMVNFVKENSLGEDELAAQNRQVQKEEENYILDNKSERKSLREQLKESRGMSMV